MDSFKLRNAVRTKYAWPGGYPMYIVMADGAALCIDCAKDNYRLIARSNRDNFTDGWKPAGVDVNYEDPELYCDHCGDRIESAYAEDDVE